MFDYLSDEELMEKIKKYADNEAFKILYDRYKSIIYNYLDKLIFNKEDLNDVFQEVFSKLFFKAKNYNERYDLKTWLFKIATNSFIDYYRKYKRLKIDYTKLIKENFTSFEDELLKKEELIFFYEALNLLKSPYRECFILKYIEDLTLNEISFILGISSRTLKKYCLKAEDFIKSYIQKKYKKMN